MKCSFCGKDTIQAVVIMDLNNNTYCDECAREKLEINFYEKGEQK